ncbi:MAG: pyridoxal-phosphate dependent enzyme, partial [Promethearchaeota archaeon]
MAPRLEKKVTPSVQWKNPPVCSQCQTSHRTPDLWCTKCHEINTIQAIQGKKRTEMHPTTLWDFADFFPSFPHHISLQEGLTPVVSIKNVQDLRGLKLKLEFRNPTGSFRDRAATLILSDAIRCQKSNIVTVSTGSFSISIAAYSACAGINSTNIVPQNIELSKIEQMKLYGSKVIFKGDSLEEALEGSRKHIEKLKAAGADYALYYEPTPENNILTIEGQKSLGLEIALDYPEIENVIIPRGSGTLIYSIYRGLQDAQKSGWIESLPRLYAVSLEKTAESHLAESIDIQRDPRWSDIISDVVKKTGGKELTVTANRMTQEALIIARQEGLLIEPASASVVVAARILRDEDSLNMEKSVAILTGSGLNAMNIFAAQLGGLKKVVWGLSVNSAK